MSKKISFDDLPVKMQLLLYLKVSIETEPKAIFCTSDAKYHTAGEELITEGLIVEVEGPGGADRAYALTDTGKERMNVK